MQACLGVKKVRESTFHHCGGPVNLVQGCLSARKERESRFHHSGGLVKLVPGEFFFWTRFENLVAKRRKINDRVVPILVAIRNWNDVICL